MTIRGRIIDTDLADPAYTAAVDDVLLESLASGEGAPSLHLYRRDPPAVTLGYFLKTDEVVRLDRARSLGISIIRRKSGGGAIYTDPGQLIYGLVVTPFSGEDVAMSFSRYCTALSRAICSLGIEAYYAPPNDVEVGGRKVSGSAQKRKGRALLQHGTVILQLDRENMEKVLVPPADRLDRHGAKSMGERVMGLNEVAERKIELSKLKEAVSRELASAAGVELTPGELTTTEQDMVDHLVRTRYGSDEWNLRR